MMHKAIKKTPATESIPLNSRNQSEVTSASLSETSIVPQGWPSSPRAIRTALHLTIWNLLIDSVLLLSTITFLSFALIVNTYDGTNVAEHPKATQRLENATKYVGLRFSVYSHAGHIPN
jgi:hypothetical protein